MQRKIYGNITNRANGGLPVQGLKVEAWDDDWPEGDDFMGKAITNANGQYEIPYSDGFWDASLSGLSSWLPDIFITVDIRNSAGRWVRLGKSRVYKDHSLNEDRQIDLKVTIGEPLTKSTNFEPDQHGFHFINNFKVEPTILEIDLGEWEMGFCGGMCAAALRHFRDQTEIPTDTQIPKQGTPLFDELLKRQIRSTPPDLLARMYDWQSAPDVGSLWRKPSIGQRTKREWPKLKRDLDKGTPAIIILIRANGYFDNPTKNHQVLAIGYEYNTATKDLAIQVYDPNVPDKVNTLSMNLGLPDGRLYFKDSSRRRTRGFLVNPFGRAASF